MSGTDIDAFHLPADMAGRPMAVITEHDGVRALAPVLSTDDVASICRTLVSARTRLTAMPADRIVAAIDAVARQLLDQRHPSRQQVLRGITAFAGYSPEMAAYVLDRMAADWRAEPLNDLLRSELGSVLAAASFVPDTDDQDDVADTDSARAIGRRRLAVAPPLGLHVLAGNVPGVGVTSAVRALLVRSAVLAKSATGEPVLTPVFARLLAAADAEVGACVAATWWPGGDVRIEAAALEHVGMVVHYGGKDAIASFRARAGTHVRFVEHGPRISFAIINARGIDRDGDLIDTARAIATFDQHGCVSPQTIYVIGTAAEAHSLADRLATALDQVSSELPRGRISAAEAVAIGDARTRAEFGTFAGQPAALWAGDAMSFTVILTHDPAFEGTCLNRTVTIKPVATTGAVIDAVRPFGALLQTVGLAGFTDDERSELAGSLAGIGATRITSIGAMPWPPATWHHDGRGPLTELVRWVDLER